MGVSRERVRQLEGSIIKKLRQIANDQDTVKPHENTDPSAFNA
jgi:DNA-directed RNA polymerase sigma subunit (sigma70/sigma32)